MKRVSAAVLSPPSPPSGPVGMRLQRGTQFKDFVMLPPRLPKKAKRASRWRSQAHCNFVRSHGCSIPGCPGMPIEVAHVRIGSGAGMGQKPDDFNAVSLCKLHHSMQHVQGERTFWKSSGVDVQDLIDAFAKASPKAREIREARNG